MGRTVVLILCVWPGEHVGSEVPDKDAGQKPLDRYRNHSVRCESFSGATGEPGYFSEKYTPELPHRFSENITELKLLSDKPAKLHEHDGGSNRRMLGT